MKEIRRNQFSNTYSSTGFELRIPKHRKSAPSIVFAVSAENYSYSFANVSRKDAANALKKFKKSVDKTKKQA